MRTPSSAKLRFVPAIVGLVAFGIMLLLYLYDAPLYHEVLRNIGIKPWSYPFIDGEFMYATKRCWQEGVDVYVSVPCDVVADNKMAYSPLWLRLPFLPSDNAARVPIGLTTDLLLLLSVALLPPVRTLRETVLMSLAVVSTMVCFALERNNIDVWIFLLVVGGVLLFVRSGVARAIGYGAFMVAGLLKYYPFVLFGLAFKERPARFWLIFALSIAGLAIFAVWFRTELAEELPNIPGGTPFLDMFGIVNMPRAVAQVMAINAGIGAGGQGLIELCLRLLLTVAVLAWAVRLARRPGFVAAIGRLADRDCIWLVAGCLVIGGCYLLSQSVGYRGIYLLIVVSGLLALSRASDDPAVRSRLSFATVSTVAIMWMEGFHRWATLVVDALGASLGVSLTLWGAVWLARELFWVNLECVLLAVLFVVAVRWPVGAAALAWMRRFGAASAAAE